MAFAPRQQVLWGRYPEATLAINAGDEAMAVSRSVSLRGDERRIGIGIVAGAAS